MECAIENECAMFIPHTIFIKIKERGESHKAICKKKMHFYSGEINYAAPSISIFEKLCMKNGMGLTWQKRKY